MLRFILADENLPFAIALGLALALTLVQLLGVMGDADADSDADFDADFDTDGHFDLHHALHWLGVGVVPTSAFLLLICAIFGLSGYTIQSIASALTGGLLPVWPVAIAALVLTLPATSAVSRVAGKRLFREETTAVHSDSLVGGTAVITLGTASRGRPTQAKLKDQHGQTHYVLVEPYLENDSFDQGTSVVLVQCEGAKFLAVSNTVEGLEAFELAPEIPAQNHAKQSS